MISRKTKVLYYRLMRWPMRWNGAFYRLVRAPRSGLVKVHLGPGQKNYLNGWINVDANAFTARHDVWADLKNRLPFRDRTVDIFYSHHMVEHLPDSLLPFHFAEMFRCLKPGGAIRIGGPNGDSAIQMFTEGNDAWFGDWPDSRRSSGGRMVNFLLCRNEHSTILTESYLQELTDDAGYVDFVRRRPRYETNFPEFIDDSVLQTEEEKPSREFPDTLIIECVKPESD